MSRYRLRVELPDLPGALAKVATVISDLDGDLVSVDIHELDGHQAVDELVVEVLTELDSRVLASACHSAEVWVAPIDQAREVPVGRLALARGAPLVQRSHELPGPLGGRPPSPMWLLAVPDGHPNTRTIAFLARPGSLRFTASEVARVDALMALHRTLADGIARREHPATRQ